MPLGTKVGLGTGDTVLDGDPAHYPWKGAQQPPILPFLLWPNGCMHQDATWYGGRLQDGDPDPIPKFSAHMFIIVIVILLEHCTMHSRYWFVQVLVFCAFCF